ncbi:MAG: hypothetical protein M1570_11990 [Chloroflexi bacterium]|nr:hypothetical protein [Chloroflexota bacterium]
MTDPAADWRYRLRGDPAPWLLDHADNPSVYFWFQRDIVGRPEDTPALAQARELILYSAPVQALFASQDEAGGWQNSGSLDEPRHTATLWSLALLAELGVPRNSRRARAACELVLQDHVRDGEFADLGPESAGLLLHALLYFMQQDRRVLEVADRIAAAIAPGAPGAAACAIWGLSELPSAHRSPAIEEAVARGAEFVLDGLAEGEFPRAGAFPSFDDGDTLLALRALTKVDRANDGRARGAIEEVWARQRDGARWALERSFQGSLLIDVDGAGRDSKWATLDVLRVVTRL